MKLLFLASNSLEAHMLVNMLKQLGIKSASIEGEHLAGGVGELQASDFIRIVVSEMEFENASQILASWQQQEIDTPEVKSRPVLSALLSSCAGFLLGAGAVFAFYSFTETLAGADYNGDGIADELLTFKNDFIHKVEIDRNFDGEVDYVSHYNADGVQSRSKQDDDFNGTFETRVKYKHGNPYLVKTDSTGDGFADLRSTYSHGVLSKMELYQSDSRTVIKVQHFHLGKLTKGEMDTDRDGILDQVNIYNELEEVTDSYSLR